MIDDKLLVTVTPKCFELSTTSNSCPFIRWAETSAGFWQMRFFVPCTCFTLLSEDRCAYDLLAAVLYYPTFKKNF